jgi:hypothetical protein
MGNENLPENEPEVKPAADKGSQSAVATASKVVGNTSDVTHLAQSPRATPQ